MHSAVAINLRIYASDLERGDPPSRGTINGMRNAADQIEKHLKTIKRLRAKARMGYCATHNNLYATVCRACEP